MLHQVLTRLNRPKSPYQARVCKLTFGSSATEYSVHEAVITPYSQIFETQSEVIGFGWNSIPTTHHFNDIDAKLGHTIVHYFFTGTYEIIETREEDHLSTASLELQRAIEVSNVAGKYGLSKLQDLAAAQFKKHLESFAICDVLDAVANVPSLSPNHTTWLSTAIFKKLQQEYSKHDSFFTSERFKAYFGRNASLDLALLQCTVDILSNKITDLKSREAGLASESMPVEESTCVEESTPAEEPMTPDEPTGTCDEDVVVVPTVVYTPSESPSVLSDGPCQFQMEHLRDLSWKECRKCIATIQQVRNAI